MDDLRWQGHLTRIVEALLAGRLVPFLGADINLCDRPKTAEGKDVEWTEDAHFAPSNQELALFLDVISGGPGPTYRQEVRCPFAEAQELEQLPQECPLRHGGPALKLPIHNVSQYVATGEDGDTALYEALRKLFAKDNFALNSIHRFFASLPGLLRQKTKTPTYPLIVTACFDGALEQAFKEAGEPVDLVGFVGNDDDSLPGHFQHLTPEGVCHDIKDPNSYPGLDLGKRPVILKLYRGYNSKSFLITEDHYIDYLSHMGMTQLIPTSLLQILDESMLLFLGYNLSVWNQRVILRRLWKQKLDTSEKSWLAIQGSPDALDLRMWKRYSVKVLQRPDFQLEDYIAAIQERLQSVPALAPVIASASGASSERNKVFFSYSHADKQWLEKIKTALKPLLRSDQLSEWDDQQIEAGDKWREEIKNALASAKVGVLLVSQSFLASEFISSDELPDLLEAAEKNELVLIPVAIEPCTYEYSDLKDYQTLPELSRSLIGLSEVDCKAALVMIAKKIKESFDRK